MTTRRYPLAIDCRALLLRIADRIIQKRGPDFIIGGKQNPYLLRWFVIPRNPIANIYLHVFLRDDDDRALHDHPWPSVSIVLRGGYWEHLSGGRRHWRKPGAMVARRATCAHRVELSRLHEGVVPATSLFLTGLRLRNWGFHCPQGWVPWQKFVASSDSGAVGPGCDQ